MKTLTTLIALCAGPALASCPDPSLSADEYTATGAGLIAPQTWPVQAMGEADIPCDDWVKSGVILGETTGLLPIAPTAQFQLSGLGPHILMVMAQAECGAVVAARTGDGVWYVGETANEREEITLWGASDGVLQVWVGSKGEESCDGTLTLETFDR